MRWLKSPVLYMHNVVKSENFLGCFAGTRKGKLSKKANLKQGKSITDKISGIRTTLYRFRVAVEPDFGLPGAFIIKSQHKREFYLQSLVLQAQDDTVIHFECSSWIYPSWLTQVDRVFFSNNVSRNIISLKHDCLVTHQISFLNSAVLYSKPNTEWAAGAEERRAAQLERRWKRTDRRMGSNL